MRILMLNHNEHSHGGAETHMLDLAKLLRQDNNEVFMFSPGEQNIDNDYKRIVMESEGKLISNIHKFFFYIGLFRELRSYIKRINPDIIHIHNHYRYSLTLLLACLGKIPVVQTVHDYGLICPSSWAVTKDNYEICSCVNGIGIKCIKKKCITPRHYIIAFLRNKLRFYISNHVINAYIAPSKKLKEYLERYGIKPVHYIPHFIFPTNNAIAEKEETITFASHLGKNKGAEYLIKAMPVILKRFHSIKLLVIGSGPEKEYLISLAGSLGIKDSVIFLGYLPKDDVRSYISKSKLVILPSIWMEQFGLIGLEAMSAGTPVIASNIGGIPDWLEDNHVGYLTKPKSSDDIAEKVILLLSDEKKLKEFSVNAINHIKKFSPDIYLDSIKKVYKELAADR